MCDVGWLMGRGTRLIGCLVLPVCLGVLAPGAAAAQGCGVAVVSRTAPDMPVVDWAENVGFDHAGNLWVTRALTNRVERYDADGVLTGVITVQSPGAIRPGPDGLMYVTEGNAVTGLLPGASAGAVLRFDPTAAQPVTTVVIDGLAMPNGMAIADDGALYVADSGRGLLRIRPDGTLDEQWTANAPKNLDLAKQVNGFSINGLAILGDSLYTTVTVSPTARVLRVPLDDPGTPQVVADLLPSALTAYPDDLVATADGALLVATTLGSVVRVDPTTGQTCAVGVGEPVTAFAVDPTAPNRVLASTISGAILVLDVAP